MGSGCLSVLVVATKSCAGRVEGLTVWFGTELLRVIISALRPGKGKKKKTNKMSYDPNALILRHMIKC